MRIIVLTDNHEYESFGGEWGLAVYIEHEGKKYLLDTGKSDLFIENAEKLGIDLKDIDYAVLSHAHYDHSDGMRDFFAVNDKADFYVQESCSDNCYKKRWFTKKYIGIPRHILADYPNRFKYARGLFKLDENVYILGHSTPGLDKMGKKNHMIIKTNQGYKPDDFKHEQSLIFLTGEGMVILNSCCHSGADIVVKEAMQAFPDKKVLALIGGFHLFNRKDKEILELAKELKTLNPKLICTGHCTGDHAFMLLKNELGDMVEGLYSGKSMEIS